MTTGTARVCTLNQMNMPPTVSLRARRDTTQVMLGVSLRATWDTTLVIIILDNTARECAVTVATRARRESGPLTPIEMVEVRFIYGHNSIFLHNHACRTMS